jgi:hypothetical protein
MTTEEAHCYATAVMLLYVAGTIAFNEHVKFMRDKQSEWEAVAERAIVQDRLAGTNPNDKARLGCLLYSDEGLWIRTQHKLANRHPNSSPQDLWSSSHTGYVSVIKAGIVRDTMSALVLLELSNRVILPLFSKLERVRDLSFLNFVVLANRKTTRDELLELQEVIPMLAREIRVDRHFQHFYCNGRIPRYHPAGIIYGDREDYNQQAPTRDPLQNWGSRARSTGTGQGSNAAPTVFERSFQHTSASTAKSGHRPNSGSSSTALHNSTTSSQAEESISKRSKEEHK